MEMVQSIPTSARLKHAHSFDRCGGQRSSLVLIKRTAGSEDENGSVITSGKTHTTPDEFENAAIMGHFEFLLRENLVREIIRSSKRHRLVKLRF